MKICSVYNSIDGEYNCFYGSGQLTTFIRLHGCNLNCSWCDTQYAQDSSVPANEELSVKELIKKYSLLRSNKFTITGGEPLLQEEEVYELCQELYVHEYVPWKQITIETNGSIIPSERPSQVRYVYDYKLPSSGMQDRMHPRLLETACTEDAIKFVCADLNDYRIMCIKVQRTRAMIVVSTLPEVRTVIVDRLIQDRPFFPRNTVFNIQLHKILWPDAQAAKREV